MVVFDATIILPLIWSSAPPPRDPVTNSVVEGYRDRVDHLIKTLEKNRTKILIPTPALSEVLVRGGRAGPTYLTHISSSSAFRIAPFDTKAAVELAAMTARALADGDKKGATGQTWAKVKFDRQIIAIAKAESAKVIYSDDRGVRHVGEMAGLTVIKTADLPLPPVDPQGSLLIETLPDDQDQD